MQTYFRQWTEVTSWCDQWWKATSHAKVECGNFITFCSGFGVDIVQSYLKWNLQCNLTKTLTWKSRQDSRVEMLRLETWPTFALSNLPKPVSIGKKKMVSFTSTEKNRTWNPKTRMKNVLSLPVSRFLRNPRFPSAANFQYKRRERSLFPIQELNSWGRNAFWLISLCVWISLQTFHHVTWIFKFCLY